jgi:hypothetical protein
MLSSCDLNSDGALNVGITKRKRQTTLPDKPDQLNTEIEYTGEK